MCGFNNAAVFQTIEAKDIDSVENYIRTVLAAKFANACDGGKIHFFGTFAEKPSEFVFNAGERRLVIEIVEHIKKTALAEGLHRFKVNQDLHSIALASSHELCHTVIGCLFKKLPGPMDLLPFSDETWNNQPEFIDISQYQLKKEDNSQSEISNALLNHNAEGSSPNEVNYTANFGTLTGHLVSNGSLPVDIPNIAYDFDMLTNGFFTQLYVQNIRNKNCTTINDEVEKIFIVDSRSRKQKETLVKVCEISPNGNCLFGAVAHQLFNVKANSPDHPNKTKELRQSVVDCILKNVELYQQDLKDRMLQDFDFKIDVTDFKQSCIDFVKSKLSQNGYYGGMESLIALSQLHRMNILIVNDDGTSNMGNRFNPDYQKVIIVSFKTNGKRGNKNNHYDSVTQLSDKMLSKFCENTIQTFKTWIELENEIRACNNFVISVD